MDNLTEEELLLIMWGGNEDFKGVTKKEVDDQGRWSVYCSKVVQHTPTGNYYRLSWSEGSTEYQGPDLNPTLTQVYPKEITTTIYATDAVVTA